MLFALDVLLVFKNFCLQIKPPRALFNFGHSREELNRGGLITEGGLLTKSNDIDTNDSFSVVLLHILRIQHTILQVKCINSAQFPSQTELS